MCTILHKVPVRAYTQKVSWCVCVCSMCASVRACVCLYARTRAGIRVLVRACVFFGKLYITQGGEEDQSTPTLHLHARNGPSHASVLDDLES